MGGVFPFVVGCEYVGCSERRKARGAVSRGASVVEQRHLLSKTWLVYPLEFGVYATPYVDVFNDWITRLSGTSVWCCWGWIWCTFLSRCTACLVLECDSLDGRQLVNGAFVLRTRWWRLGYGRVNIT